MTQQHRVLQLLRENPNGVTTAMFLEAQLPRFSARLQELRDQGHKIVSEQVRVGSWRYRLLRETPAGSITPNEKPPGGAAADPPTDGLFALTGVSRLSRPSIFDPFSEAA